MQEYTTSEWAAMGVSLSELIAALLLHSIGLYLLLTARNKKIMIWILAHLSFLELSNVIYDSVNSIRLLFIGKVIHIEKYDLAIFTFFLSAQFLTLMTITIERVIAVKLTIKYIVVVNKRRLLFVFTCIWIVSVAMSLIVLFSTKPAFNIVLAFWEILVAIVTISSYVYIALTVKSRRKRLSLGAQNMPRQRLNLTVPFLIVLTLICFYFIPDMLLAVGVEYSIWFNTIFYLNFLTDALIYIFGLPQFRNRVKRFCCREKVRSRTDMTRSSVLSNISIISITDDRAKETSV